MTANIGTDVSVGQGETQTYYVPGAPQHDAVRLAFDSADTSSPDVTVEFRTYDDDNVREAYNDGVYSQMETVSKTANIDPSSGDPTFGTDRVGRVVAVRVTENNNTSGDDVSGTIKLHNATHDFRTKEGWLSDVFRSEEARGTVAASPGFGSWTTVDEDRGAWVLVDATTETDGTSRGEVEVAVDESGGTTADYTYTVAHIPPESGAGAVGEGSARVYVPAGGQYQIVNASDPNTASTIENTRYKFD